MESFTLETITKSTILSMFMGGKTYEPPFKLDNYQKSLVRKLHRRFGKCAGSLEKCINSGNIVEFLKLIIQQQEDENMLFLIWRIISENKKCNQFHVVFKKFYPELERQFSRG